MNLNENYKKLNKKTYGGIKITFKKNKNGTEDVTITCEFCGEPIGLYDPEFGMDCKNECSKKRLRERLRGKTNEPQ